MNYKWNKQTEKQLREVGVQQIFMHYFGNK